MLVHLLQRIDQDVSLVTCRVFLRNLNSRLVVLGNLLSWWVHPSVSKVMLWRKWRVEEGMTYVCHALFFKCNHQWHFRSEIFEFLFHFVCDFLNERQVLFFEESYGLIERFETVFYKLLTLRGVECFPTAVHPDLNVLKPLVRNGPQVVVRCEVLWD